MKIKTSQLRKIISEAIIENLNEGGSSIYQRQSEILNPINAISSMLGNEEGAKRYHVYLQEIEKFLLNREKSEFFRMLQKWTIVPCVRKTTINFTSLEVITGSNKMPADNSAAVLYLRKYLKKLDNKARNKIIWDLETEGLLSFCRDNKIV